MTFQIWSNEGIHLPFFNLCKLSNTPIPGNAASLRCLPDPSSGCLDGFLNLPVRRCLTFLRTLPFLWPFLFHLISLQTQIGCAQFSLCLPSCPGPSLHHKALPSLIDPFAAPFWITVMIPPFSSVPGLSPTPGAPAKEFQWLHKPTEEQPALSQSGRPSSTGLTCPGRGTSSWFPGALHTTTAPASYLHPALLPTVLSGVSATKSSPLVQVQLQRPHILCISSPNIFPSPGFVCPSASGGTSPCSCLRDLSLSLSKRQVLISLQSCFFPVSPK